MAYAAEVGHIDIVKLMLNKGAVNIDIAMGQASLSGQTGMVDFLISQGATHCDTSGIIWK